MTNQIHYNGDSIRLGGILKGVVVYTSADSHILESLAVDI